MSLQAAYKQFLAAPNPSLLAEDASLHYITTLVSIKGSSAIVKHLSNQSHDLKKKEELFLDVVEGPNGIATEIHTTMEFLTGGGSYLPSLDDNFLADRVVTFPIVRIHISAHHLPLLIFADSHCYFRWKRIDPTDQTTLGPRISPEAYRCHRKDGTELANS